MKEVTLRNVGFCLIAGSVIGGLADVYFTTWATWQTQWDIPLLVWLQVAYVASNVLVMVAGVLLLLGHHSDKEAADFRYRRRRDNETRDYS